MNKKLYISTPCYDAMLTMQYTMSLLRLVQFCNQHNIDYMIDFLGNESLIKTQNENVVLDQDGRAVGVVYNKLSELVLE